MAIRFSILPPPIGMEDVNVPLIPDIDELLKFSDGDIGIYDSMKKGFLYKSLQSGEFSSKESMDTFKSTGGFNTTNDTESYKKSDSNRYNIPQDDIELDGSSDMGLKSMEKVLLKSIFETQKPYMEFIPKAIKILSSLEDISCRVQGIIDKSLKPEFNDKSLTYKLNKSTEELDKLQNLGKDRRKPFENLSKQDKKNGIDLRSVKGNNGQVDRSLTPGNYSWEIISTEYSTGRFIEGVDYTTIYKNILENPLILDDSKNDIPPIVEDKKPPTIVFAHYDHNGDISTPPTQWLDRVYTQWAGPTDTKWYGEWEQLNVGDSGKYNDVLKGMVGDRLEKKIGIQDQNLTNQIFKSIEPKIDAEDFIEEGNKNCFMELITKTTNGLDLGSDSSSDVNKVTSNKRRMFLPKKINFKGKEVIVDPEADYNLQIIKLVPTLDVWESNGNRDVNNNNLKITTPLTSNYRGSNVSELLDPSEYTYKSPPPTEKARVQTINKYRYDGEKVSYVIEGILNENPKNLDGDVNDDDKWYGKSDFFGAVKKFIDAVISIFVDILPEINTLITLFKSPHELLFDTFFDKLEKGFGAFSKNLMGKFSSLSGYNDKFERAEFIKSDPDLKKYVSLDEDLNYRFILDGFSGMELLGYSFGINITNFIPKLVLDKSNGFSLKSDKESINPNFLPTQPRNNVNGSDNDNIEANMRKENLDGSYTWQTISTEYSTGDFIKGVDYKYIYITEDVERLLSKGDELFEEAVKSNDRDTAVDSLTEYNMALEKDPNNNSIKDKIIELKEKFKLELNMILQLLMNIVSLPIKIVFSILEEFKILFEELAKIKEIPSKLEEFLSFEWILKYVKPDYILDLIGLSFDPQLLFTWLDKIKSGELDNDYEFDLSKIVSVPFISKLPKVNKDQLEVMKTKPLELMTSVFKLIEQLIEGILCFIWNILNLDTIIPCPKFPLSKFASANLSPEKLAELLNNESDPLNDDDTSYRLVYDIKLPDGSVVKGLNYAELQNFIKSNEDFNYEVS